jgi:hypothetical protein
MRAVILLTMSIMLGPAGAGLVPASATDGLEYSLGQRYAVSRIEIEDDRRQGAVTRRGTILVLQEDGIPANEFRVLRPMVHNPRSHIPNRAKHLHNYARIEIDHTAVRTEERGAFRLKRGTRLVVLNLRTEADRIRLFTHTADPIAVAPGSAAYGCTEFVFHPDRALSEARDAATIQRVIERLLKVEAAGQAAHSGVDDARPLAR